MRNFGWFFDQAERCAAIAEKLGWVYNSVTQGAIYPSFDFNYVNNFVNQIQMMTDVSLPLQDVAIKTVLVIKAQVHNHHGQVTSSPVPASMADANTNENLENLVDHDEQNFSDTASVVSSLDTDYELNDPLVAIIGIGECDGLPNLGGVPKDYENVLSTFCEYWYYHVLYQLEDNKYIYTNNLNELAGTNNKNEYKLKWNGDDIDNFIQETRKRLIKHKHDGNVSLNMD